MQIRSAGDEVRDVRELALGEAAALSKQDLLRGLRIPPVSVVDSVGVRRDDAAGKLRMPPAQGATVCVAATVPKVPRRTEDPGVERIPEAAGPSVETPPEAVAQTPVVALVVAAGDPADIGRPPVPVHVAGGVDGAREPEPTVAGMHVPTAVVVGERTPGIPSDPVQSGGRIRPAASAVRLPVVFDLGLPGPAILDFDPPAMPGQGGAVAVCIDGRIGREPCTVTLRPFIQRCGSDAGPVLEFDPRVVETPNQERFATADDHRTPLGDDFGESVQHRDFGRAVAIALDLVAAFLLGVDPGVRRVDRRQFRVQQVVRDFQAEPALVQDVKGVRIVGIR